MDLIDLWRAEQTARLKRAASEAADVRAVDVLARVVERLYERLDVELAEIRDALIEVDHQKATRRELAELRARVDALEAAPAASGGQEGEAGSGGIL